MTFEEACDFRLANGKRLGDCQANDWASLAQFHRDEAVRIDVMPIEEFMADEEHYSALIEYHRQLDEALLVVCEKVAQTAKTPERRALAQQKAAELRRSLER